jgi:uncharacterized protein YcbX
MGSHGGVAGRVASLHRFPVKSTSGESPEALEVEARGVVHDRIWAAYTADGGIVSGKTTRRFRRVDGFAAWRSAVEPDGTVVVRAPAGDRYRVDDPAASAALTAAFGRPLELRRETDAPHHDDCPVHVVTTASLRAVAAAVSAPVDARRSRANVVLETDGEGFVEDDWTGRDLALGPEVVLRIGVGMPRCVMVDRAQAGVDVTPPVLTALGRAHDVLLGVMADVVRGGTVRVGDVARLVPLWPVPRGSASVTVGGSLHPWGQRTSHDLRAQASAGRSRSSATRS